MQINDHDTVNLPSDIAREREPFARIIRDHPAWPSRALRIYFEFNDALGEAGQWIWYVGWGEDEPDEGDRPSEADIAIPRSPARYGAAYQCQNYFLFTFLDLSKGVDTVRPGTLGDQVDLIGYPLPDSPGWRDWVERQDFATDEERREMLARGTSVTTQ